MVSWGLSLLFWLIVVALVVLAIRAWSRSRGSVSGIEGAEARLKERLAKGEISIEDYEKTRTVLRG